MAAKRALGTGLNALFGDTPETNEEQGELMYLPIERVEPRADQPRKNFDPAALEELAESIRTFGLIQPITVRPLDGEYYQIIAGERRWRAARMAGLRKVPVRVLEKTDDRLTAELALVENLQRADLNPLEEAEGYRQLMNDYGLTQEEAAARVGKSRPAVANALRLLALTPPVRELLQNGELSAGHARALLVLQNPDVQLQCARHVIDSGLSVRQTETFCAKLQRGAPEPKEDDPHVIKVDYRKEAERSLSDRLGRGVKITGGIRKGRIVLDFYSAEDRDDLIDALLALKARKIKEEE